MRAGRALTLIADECGHDLGLDSLLGLCSRVLYHNCILDHDLASLIACVQGLVEHCLLEANVGRLIFAIAAKVLTIVHDVTFIAA